jgi:hypothetical protein
LSNISAVGFISVFLLLFIFEVREIAFIMWWISVVSMILGSIIKPVNGDGKIYKRKKTSKILFIVSEVLFFIPTFIHSFLDKLGYLDEIILLVWILALITLIAGFIIKPFVKKEKEITEKDNKICDILFLISFALWVLAIVLLVSDEDIAWPVILLFIVPIELILSLCFGIKYPNYKLGYIASCITSIVMISIISFFVYTCVLCMYAC